MPRHDHLRHRGHPEQIRPDGPVEPHLGRRLIGRPRAPEIHPLARLEAQFRSLVQGQLLQLQVVGAGHVREARSHLVQIGPDQRIGEHADVVADDHQVAHPEIRIRGPRGIGDEEELHPQHRHRTHADGHEFHRIALIIVEAPLHGNHRLAAELADDEIALVPHGRGDRETGNVAVGDHDGIFDAVGQAAQAAAEYDADQRGIPARLLADIVRRHLPGSYSAVHVIEF